MKVVRTIFVICLVCSFILNCKNSSTGYQYRIPEMFFDGWEVGRADLAGVNSELLAEMMDLIIGTPEHHIHSILIFKNSRLIFEEYFEGYLYSSDPPGSNGDYIQFDRETDHYLASVSKTITSVIFGTAVKEGFIKNIDAKVLDFFPEYQDILTGDKANITLKHLLTMSSGLAWDESSTSYENPANDVAALFHSEDPLAYILSRPLLSTPGTEFLYNSGGTNVLGAVIEKSTGMSLLDFGNQYLFDPLGIEGGRWQRLPGGNYFASGGVFLRPRELAKIGYLFLNNGYWHNTRIISEDWIWDSVYEHIETHGRTLTQSHAYGYQWWIQDFQSGGATYNSFLAAGWGDQYMFIFPSQEMIVLFNCGNFMSGGPLSPFSLTEDYILRSLE